MRKWSISWILQCLGLLAASCILHGFLEITVTPVVLRILARKYVIHLPRATEWFTHVATALRYERYLDPLYGLLLGLIPLAYLLEAGRALLARFSAKPVLTAESELDSRRPILWIWAPVFLIELVRFLLWRSPDPSVLATTPDLSRFHYFFDEASILGFPKLVNSWLIDRELINLTLFLAAYPLGVWLRHQWPSPPAPTNERTAEEPTEAPG